MFLLTNVSNEGTLKFKFISIKITSPICKIRLQYSTGFRENLRIKTKTVNLPVELGGEHRGFYLCQLSIDM